MQLARTFPDTIMRRLSFFIFLSASSCAALASDSATAPAAATTQPAVATDAGASASAAIAERLDALAPMFQVPAPPVPESLMPRAGDACAVEVATAALLYRNAPDKWRNSFFDLLVIDDYVARSRKHYNLVDIEEVAGIIDNAHDAVPGVTEPRMRSAVAFCELKRSQPFIMTRKAGMISLTRVVRGMMLADLLQGVEEDALGIANAIDAHTLSLHPGLELPWEKPLE
jgi:hypothetical protein